MKRLSMAVFFAGLFSANTAMAELAHVAPCGPDQPGHARSVAEPWEANTQTFANGAIRVAVLDTIEPAVASFYLMVLSPPYDELGDRQCRIVSFGAPRMGFSFLSLERAEASYDPNTGLRIVMDMGRYNFESGLNDVWALAVTINQATGLVTGEW